MQIATPFGSSKNKYSFMGQATTVNGYPEIRGEGDKARFVILPAPGMTSFSAVTDTPCRGSLYLEDLDSARVVHSGRVWKVVSAGTATNLGIVPGVDPVAICRNKKTTPQTVIQCDAGVYLEEGEVVARINDSLLDDCIWVESHAGYIIYMFATGRFRISAQNEAATIDSLDFATADQNPDKLICGKAVGDTVLFFKQFSIEPWRHTGNADFPYEPIPGAVIRKGILAPHSLREFDNSLVWVGLSKEGDRAVYRLDGYQPVKISTPEVDRAIAAETSPEDIEGFSYSMEGHAFYTITGETFSYTYGLPENRWHPRKSYGRENWRARFSFQGWNKIIVGDRLTGSLFELDPDVFTENDETMVFDLTFPTMHIFPNGGIVDALHLDMLTGRGAVLSTAQGYDPKAMLTKSTDGGNTFGSERELDLGRSGEYYTRVTTRRLGKMDAQGAVFRLRISDPIPRGLALADAAVRPLKK